MDADVQAGPIGLRAGAPVPPTTVDLDLDVVQLFDGCVGAAGSPTCWRVGELRAE